MRGYSIFRRGQSRVYSCWIVDQTGRRRLRSTGTTNKAEAVQVVQRLLRGEQELKSTTYTLKQFFADYLSYSRSQHKTKTQQNAESCLRTFVEFVGESTPISKVTVQQAQQFVNLKNTTASAATARRNHLALGAAFAMAVLWKHLNVNVWRSVKKPRIPERTPRWLSIQEFALVRDALEDAIQKDKRLLPSYKRRHERESAANKYLLGRMMLVAFMSGLRSAELCNLRFADIDLERRQLHLQNTEEWTTKSGRQRIVPLNSTLMQLFTAARHLHKGATTDLVFRMLYCGRLRQVSADWLSRSFKVYVKAAGLDTKLNWHSLRHSYASNLVSAGIPLVHIAKLMGHRDQKTTQIYAHLAVSELADVAAVLDDPDVRAFLKGRTDLHLP